MIKVIKAIN